LARERSIQRRDEVSSAETEVRIGTSGWTYPHWTGTFYPKGVGANSKKQLAFIASRFSTVEINGTFYSLSTPETCRKWRATVPPDFVFAVKASRFVTYNLRLAGGEKPLANFFAQGILLLGKQLGPLLWQVPPQLAFEMERAERFIDSLPRDTRAAEKLAERHDERVSGRAAVRSPDDNQPLRHAFEVRHPSWLEDRAVRLFERNNLAVVVADTAGVHPSTFEQTADFTYVRLHGARKLYASRYTDDEIGAWARRVRGWARSGRHVFVYFDNDNKAYAPGDAERLRARLERRVPAPWSAEPPREVPDPADRFRAAR
jgi:uncharacterized protein YecE (DUF72 family)